MYRFFVLSCLLTYTQASDAISNIENERPNQPNQGLSGSIHLSFKGKTGNQKEQSAETAAKVIYRLNDDYWLLLLGRNTGSQHDTQITDNHFLHLRWVHLLNQQWALESFAQREQDQFEHLTSRVLAGGGGRYIAAQQKDIYSLTFGLGGFREHEKQNLIDHEENNYLWRVNTYYSYKYQLNEQVSFVNTTYYQPSSHNFDDYRLLFDAGFSVKLSNSLQLKLNYTLTHDSRPVQNLAVTPPIANFATNSEYKTSISYRF